MKRVIRIWSIFALLAIFTAGSVTAQTEAGSSKTTTSKVTSKTKSKKKPKKKSKKSASKSKATPAKATTTKPPATPAKPASAPVPAPSQQTPPPSKPEPKPAPAPVTAVEESMKIVGGLTIYGTSTLHSWTMSSNAVQGTATITTESGELDKLSAVTFIVPVKTLKGESNSMNENAYEALKEEKFKDIRFALSSARVRRESAGHYSVDLSGSLTIAGVTKPINATLAAVKNGNTFACTGSETVRMTNFGVERPTFMLGAMKTGDDVTIKYNVALQPR